MPTLIERRQSLDTKNEKLIGILSGGNDLTADEMKTAGDLQAEIKADLAQFNHYAELEATAEEVKTFMNSPAKPFALGGTQKQSREDATLDLETDEVSPIKGWTKDQWNTISTKSYNDTYHKYLAKGRDGLSAPELKVLQEGIDSSGGFLAPDQIQNELIQKKPTPTPIQDRVRRYTTSRDSLSIPKQIWTTDDLYTSGVRATKTGEVPASSTTAAITDPVFGQVKIEIFTEMMSGQLTRDMVEDSMFDLLSVMGEQYHQAKSLKMDYKILNGTGANEQVGILASPGGTIGAQAQPAVVNLGSPLSADGLVKMGYAIPIQYEDDTVWVFNKVNTQAGIALLKDSQNRYMFAYGGNDDKLASARPKSLLGYDLVRSAFMPDAYASDISTANANAFPVIFGDLSGYAVIERVGLSIQVLDQTKAKDNQIELVGRFRWGGSTVEEYKLKIGKVA